MTRTKAYKRLKELHERLEKLKTKKRDDVNLFDIFHLQSAERHHSSVFAGLLSPQSSHHLGGAAIKKFLYYLWNDTVREETYKPRRGNAVTLRSLPNTAILRAVAQDRRSLVDLAQGDIEVQTEVYTNDNGRGKRAGYIDILVKISEEIENEPQEEAEGETALMLSDEIPTRRNANVKTVIVIENKTGTQTHSDQLRKYEEYIKINYPDSKAIFVLLSPHGSLPIDRGGDEQYNDRYCIFDYGEEQGIAKILEELIAESDTILMQTKLKAKQKRKIKMSLEDYKDMVEKDILTNDPGLRRKIKDLFKDFPDIMPYIVNYYDNVSDLLKHAEEYLDRELNGIEIIARNANSLFFYTKTLGDLYARNGTEPTSQNSYIISVDGPSEVRFVIKAKIGPAQAGDPYRSGVIETWDQRDEKLEGQFLTEINERLKEFCDRIKYFESKIQGVPPQSAQP